MLQFDAENLVPIGTGETKLQATWSARLFSETPTFSLEVSGPRKAVVDLALACHGSPASLPAGFPCAYFGDGDKIVLADLTVRGDNGSMATLTAVYRRRNDRETDADVALGLRSRTVSARWVERQEMIEHYAARLARSRGFEFDAELFALWLDEPDPALKKAYKVAVGDEEVELEGGTKAVAQRYAMGIQYAAMRMMQVEVAETWTKPPTITSSNANAVLAGGIPANHRPLFNTTGNSGIAMTWMQLADGVQHHADGFARSVVYLGVPQTMMPNPAPDLWGDTPIDALLHPTENAST